MGAAFNQLMEMSKEQVANMVLEVMTARDRYKEKLESTEAQVNSLIKDRDAWQKEANRVREEFGEMHIKKTEIINELERTINGLQAKLTKIQKVIDEVYL